MNNDQLQLIALHQAFLAKQTQFEISFYALMIMGVVFESTNQIATVIVKSLCLLLMAGSFIGERMTRKAIKEIQEQIKQP